MRLLPLLNQTYWLLLGMTSAVYCLRRKRLRIRVMGSTKRTTKGRLIAFSPKRTSTTQMKIFPATKTTALSHTLRFPIHANRAPLSVLLSASPPLLPPCWYKHTLHSSSPLWFVRKKLPVVDCPFKRRIEVLSFILSFCKNVWCSCRCGNTNLILTIARGALHPWEQPVLIVPHGQGRSHTSTS